jgi:GT2 family glycosyltransferase
MSESEGTALVGAAGGSGSLERGMQAAPGRAYVVLVNWNGWEDTIECLESLLRLDHPDVRIVVCDNGSTDGSLERLEAWASGSIDAVVPRDHPLREHSFPPVPKPVPCVRIGRSVVEVGDVDAAGHGRVVLLDAGGNRGYAGGTNLALRFVRACGDAGFVWLLNNDTVVHPGALSELVEKLSAEPMSGICGSTVLHYSFPGTIQALGGFAYNPWLGTSRRLHERERASRAVEVDERDVKRQMYGVYGASALVTARFLEEVGPMCESYFLYFEEQDWALRARRRGFEVAFAARSIVYHKEGRSTGGSAVEGKSRLSDYHSVKSRMLFTRKHYPQALPTVLLGLVGTLANRVRRRQWDRISMMCRVALQAAFARDAADTVDSRW